MKNFVDKILAFRDFQSQTDRNDLTLTDFADEVLDAAERSNFSLEEMSAVDKTVFNEAINPTNKNEKENMNTLELLEKVTEAATFLYVKNSGDTISPNILVSKLPNKQYYVSLNRYMTPTDRFKKTIMCKATNLSLRDALLDIAKFLSKQAVVQTNPLEELGKLFDKPVIADYKLMDVIFDPYKNDGKYKYFK